MPISPIFNHLLQKFILKKTVSVVLKLLSYKLDLKNLTTYIKKESYFTYTKIEEILALYLM